MQSRKSYLIALSVTLVALSLSSAATAANKHALIVTIGEYEEDTGWDSLASNNDLPLIRFALERHGFNDTNIVHLPESKATRDGIMNAIREHLIEPSSAGDIAVFHYSGHGQRITDDGRDELDGFDEALVPVNAPKSAADGYTGQKHLRDDDLGDLLYELRQKIGLDGDVLVFLDSCYSGTGTRGGDYPNPVRGTADTIGEARQQDGRNLEADVSSGAFDASARTRGAAADGPAKLASMVVLSAETHDRLAEEATDERGERVGALSWALSKALSEAGSKTTYEDLFDAVKTHTAERSIPNRPQMESDDQLNRGIFGGEAVDQQPYFQVTSIEVAREPSDGIVGWADVEGGWLVGLEVGTVIEIQGETARGPGDDERIATGTIDLSTPATSVVALNEINDTSARRGRAFVTAQAFGSLKVDVYVDAPDSAGWKAPVLRALENESNKEVQLIRLLESRPEGLVSSDATKIVLIREITTGPPAGRGVTVETWDTGQTLVTKPFRPTNEFPAADLTQRIMQFARNAYLRALNVKTDGMDVELELIPCTLQCTSQRRVCGGEACTCVAEGNPADLFDDGNNLRMKMGAGFGVRLINNGNRDVYVSVLDLMPDGSIGLLWPLPGTSTADTVIKANDSYRIPDPRDRDRLLVYRACPPFGTDMLKALTTLEPVDFGPITRGTRTRGGARGPLDELLQESLTGVRGTNPAIAVGSVSTSSVTLTVEAEATESQ